jgi:outer membrane receptor protein involved in Fe transport
MRYDWHSEAGSAFAPRVSIVRIFNGNQSIRLVAARAFKFPSYNDNYSDVAIPYIVQKGNRDIDPEQLTSFELSWQVIDPDRFSITASAFYNRYDDKIDMVYEWNDNYLLVTRDNEYDFDQYGFEFEAGLHFGHGWFVKGNYSYTWNNIPESMVSGPVPVHQLNGELRYDHPSGLWADFRIHWQDKSAYSFGNPPFGYDEFESYLQLPVSYEENLPDFGVPSGWQYIDPYAEGDLSIGYTPSEWPWSLRLGVHNIFHSRHEKSQYHNKADTTVSGVITYYFH